MAKNIEKDAQFLSSDDAQINALQNKKDNIIPLKRQRKQKLCYTSDENVLPEPSKFFLYHLNMIIIYFIDSFEICLYIALNKRSKKNIQPSSCDKTYEETSDEDIRSKLGIPIFYTIKTKLYI